MDEARTGIFEARNEVEDDVLRLACKILARFVGVRSSTKGWGGVDSGLVRSPVGGDLYFEKADIAFRTGVARVPGINGLVVRASLGPIFSDETASRLNG